MRSRTVLAALGLLIAIASIIPVGRALAQVSDVDLGTIGLQAVQQISPSRVFRPMDMIGARAGGEAWGMGGAYVADARGVGAVPWNPAGLGWMQGSNLSGDMRILKSSGTTSSYPDSFSIPRVPRLSVRRYAVDLKSSIRYGMLGAATSKEIDGHHIAGALSYRRYVDMAYPEQILEDLVQADVTTYPVTFAFDNAENGGVDAAAASVGFEAIPNLLSVGMNLNILMGKLRSDEQMMVAAGGPQNSVGEIRSGANYNGHSLDLGAQFRKEGIGALGVRLTPGYSLKVRNGTFSVRSIPTSGTTFSSYSHAKVAPYDIDVPPLLSLGGWVHVLPQLDAAFEWNHQSWSSAKVKYTQGEPAEVIPWTDACGQSFMVDLSQVSGLGSGLPMRDVTSYHVGLEAHFLRIGGVSLPVRLGYNATPFSVAPLAVRTIDVPQSVLDPNSPNYCPTQAEKSTTIAFAAPGDGDIKSNAYTMGLGFETGNVRYDLSYEVRDYRLKKFYFDSPNDAFVNPQHVLIDVDRRVTTMRLSATLSL